MNDTFALWQPRYAEAGIPVFPLDGKMPLVKRYHRMGIPATSKLRSRFADADAFGFACGPMSGITVLDFDTTDERVVAETLEAAGPTPILVQTHSGRLHAWYRHSGEGRRTRIDGLPIDVLGRGIAVAPPSRGQKGSYRFIMGSLNDIASLPTMRPLPRSEPTMASRSMGAGVNAHHAGLPEGCRNNTLFRFCLQQVGRGEGDELPLLAEQFNRNTFQVPLPPTEVAKTVESALRLQAEGRNWCSTGQRVITPFEDIDGLLYEAPDSFILLTILRRHHAGLRDEFCIANGMADRMPGKRWSRLRFARARTNLELWGYVEQTKRPCPKTGPALYRFGCSS